MIRAIGAGINELGMMPRFLDLFDLDFFLVALRYTLMEHDSLDSELPYCERRDVGIIIGGVFSLRHHRDRGRARRQVQLRRRVARGDGQGPAHRRRCASATACRCRRQRCSSRSATRAWPRSFRAPFRPDQVEANLGYFRHAIPAAFWQELRHERLIREDAPLPEA